MGRLTSITFCLILLIGFGLLLFQLLSGSVWLLREKLMVSKEKIITLGELVLHYLGGIFGIQPEAQKMMMPQLYEYLLQQSAPLLRQTVALSAGTLAMLTIIPVFVMLILYYRELLVRSILLWVPQEQQGAVTGIFRELTTTYFGFAKGMLTVYLIVGLLNSIGFLLLGLPNAIYFGILAAVLTFFPYIGIMIGGLAAVVVAWITFESVWYPLGVVMILGVVQYLEANFIFPAAVGHQLKLNTLATLVAIVIGGIIWGAIGMVLFVPFAAILKILADRIESLAALASFLGPDIAKNPLSPRKISVLRWWPLKSRSS